MFASIVVDDIGRYLGPVFMPFMVRHSANKLASLIACNEAMNHYILHTPTFYHSTPRFHALRALLPRACHKPFNVDVQSPHASLEGRGNVVVLCDVMVVTMLLEWWQKIKSCWWRAVRTGVIIVKR
jgi:hypothetical protein